jgi:glycosyltransferase involved in cell wall biosynthesis
MNILMLNANLSGRGTYWRALWFARVCAAGGRHAVTVCTVSPAHAWRRQTRREGPVTISEGPRWGYRAIPGYGSNWLDIAWRWQAVRTGAYDVVYAFEHHPNVAWPVYLGARADQVVLSDWCDWYAGAANVFRGWRLLHAWDRWREDRIRRRAQRVSVISNLLARRAADMGIPAARLHLLREGVDTTAMRPYPRAAARRRLGLADDALVVGTLYDGHAFPHLVRTCAALHANDPRVRLLLVGQASAADRTLVARAGLTRAFHATGRCTDAELPLYLSAADVCALPFEDTLANRARFPHKLGDYLACARAVVVTAVGEYPALLAAADVALVPPSLATFGAAVDQLLHDPARAAQYAARGRAWVVEQLDWRVLTPQILAFVEGRS